jgi:integrase/recombinase XerD
MEKEAENVIVQFKKYCTRRGLAEAYIKTLVDNYGYTIKDTGELFPNNDHLMRSYERLVERHLSAARLANMVKFYRHYSGFMGVEPPDIKPPKNNKSRIVFLTEIEATRLLYACKDMRDYALLCILLYGGLRRKEAAELRVQDVDLHERVLHVVTTKTHEVADCVIAPKAADALEDWLKRRPGGTPWVFPNGRGGHIRPEQVNRLVKKYATKAGIKKNVTPHVLRHTLATNMLLNGGNVAVLQKQLRHKSITSTLIPM